MLKWGRALTDFYEPLESVTYMAKNNSSSKGKRQSNKGPASPQENVVAAFNGCARCSFFLVGYRLLHDDFDKAVDEAQDGWLTLTWDHAVQQLVHKSYGCQLEADAYHYQGSCNFCRRAFIYDAAQAEEQPATLRISIKNR